MTELGWSQCNREELHYDWAGVIVKSFIMIELKWSRYNCEELHYDWTVFICSQVQFSRIDYSLLVWSVWPVLPGQCLGLEQLSNECSVLPRIISYGATLLIVEYCLVWKWFASYQGCWKTRTKSLLCNNPCFIIAVCDGSLTEYIHIYCVWRIAVCECCIVCACNNYV